MVYNTIYGTCGYWRVKVAKGILEGCQEDTSEKWVLGGFRGDKVFLGVLAKYSL